jgi:hypothetical protein
VGDELIGHETLAAPTERGWFRRPFLVCIVAFLGLWTEQITRAPLVLQAVTAVAVVLGLLVVIVHTAVRTPRDHSRRFWLFFVAVVYSVPLTVGLAGLLLRSTPRPTLPTPAPASPILPGRTP